FSASELRALRKLKTPAGIQRFLNSLSYHDADTAWSPRRVLRERVAHCSEGAVLAAAALRVIGHRPLIMDLEAEQDDDHVIAVYRSGSHWGAIAKSHFTGLRDRPPIFRTLRELALSYFDDYFNLRRQRTLRGYCRPVDLARFDDRDWMTTEKPVWFIMEHLVEIPHIPLITARQARALDRVDHLGFRAGLLGHSFEAHPFSERAEREPAPPVTSPRHRRNERYTSRSSGAAYSRLPAFRSRRRPRPRS
ncbi:MAG TPA: hypothetical protein VEJ20_08650, partial [Candidatus Eremiobacteraceae bacterium]|nr:hypothetical protein [Candidatus Eremiobacteraceae bacterium]